MKKIVSVFSVLALALTLSTAAFADKTCPMGAKDCAMSAHKCDGMAGCGEKGGCPITAKALQKAHWLLSNKAELGLSDDQVNQIKAIKRDIKKAEIRQNAEMQLFMIDIEAKLMEEKVDVEGINALVDQGSAGMIAGTKSVVEQYAKLKSTLTADQITKAKALKAEKKK